ncbi:MAG TPA: phage tail tape measure protein, partial [Gammaproteobacteria bacterium]|nr:phage tail tape measure protein [Gammaproteobacteria bacterium]
MADVEKSVEIIFGAVDKTGRTIDRIGNQLDSVSSTTQDLTEPLANATDSLLKAETAILAVGTAAAGFAAKQSADFQSGMIGIQKTTGITGTDLTKLGQQIQDLAVETGLGTDRLTELGESAGQLGVTGRKNILAFIETIGKLGQISDISGDEAAKSLARILDLSGESASNISQLGDVIVKLGNNLKTSESEITNVAQALARNISQFEASSTQITGLAGALASIGARAEGAGTAVGRTFRTIKQAIDSGGQKFRELQRLTDMTGEQLRQTFSQDAPKVFEAFLQGVNESTRSTTAVFQDFGLATDETLKVLGPLVSDTDRLAHAMKLANEAVANGTALEQEFAAILETTRNKAQRTARAFEVAAQRVGAQFAPGVQDALDATTKLFAAFGSAASGSDNGLADLLDFLNKQLKSFADEIEQVAEKLPQALEGVDVDGLLKSLRGLGDAVSGLFGDLDLTQADDLQQAIQEIIDTIGTLTNVTEGIVQSFAPLVSALTSAGGGVNDLSDETKKAIGNVLGAGRAINTLAEALSGVSGMLIGGGALLSGLGGISTAAQGAYKAVPKLTSALGSGGLLGTLTALGPYLGIGAAGVGSFALGRWGRDNLPYIQQYDRMWSEILVDQEKVKELAKTMESDAFGPLEKRVEALKALTGDQAVNVENIAAKTREYKDQITDAIDPTKEVKGVSEKLRDQLKDAFGTGYVKDYQRKLDETKGKTEDLGSTSETTGE